MGFHKLHQLARLATSFAGLCTNENAGPLVKRQGKVPEEGKSDSEAWKETEEGPRYGAGLRECSLGV